MFRLKPVTTPLGWILDVHDFAAVPGFVVLVTADVLVVFVAVVLANSTAEAFGAVHERLVVGWVTYFPFDLFFYEVCQLYHVILI